MGGAGERGGITSDEAGDELESEEQQHHEHCDAEQHVADRQISVAGDVDQGADVEDVPHGFEAAAKNQPAAEPMAWASQSNGDDTNEAAASPAVSQTPEISGRSQIPTAITPYTRGLERLGRV